MDERTRGFIENIIDEGLQGGILPSVEWIKDAIPVSSLRDLALGYALGVASAVSTNVVILEKRDSPSEEDKRTIRSMLRRRLPEITEKIERELNR